MKKILPQHSARLLMALAVLIALANGAGAQARSVVIPGAPSCAACTIDLTLVATAGIATDPYRFEWYSELHRGPRNTIIARNMIDNNSVFLLDSAGRFIRNVGRAGGAGPVFESWTFMVGTGRGDSVYLRERGGRHFVFDATLSTGRVLQHAGFYPARAFPRAGWYFVLALPNGNLLASDGVARAHSEIPAPFALMAHDGIMLRPFGTFTFEEGSEVGLSQRALSVSRDRTHIWMLRRNQYDLQRFSLAGERDLSVKVENSPWMTDWLQRPGAQYTSLEDVRDLGSGRVWIMGQVPALGAARRPNIDTATWPTSLEMMVSTVIEVVDVERGAVLASRRFEREVYSFVDDDHVARQKRDASGLVSWDIYRIQFRAR